MSKEIGSFLRVLRRSSVIRPRMNNVNTAVSSRQIHTGSIICKDEGIEKMNQTVYPFMSSLKGDIKARQEVLDYDEPWKHQPLVIFGSLGIFLVYFTMVRKEREVDEAIADTLYKGMPALEVADLRKKIKAFKKDGKDTEKLEYRLKEILTPPQNKNL